MAYLLILDEMGYYANSAPMVLERCPCCAAIDSMVLFANEAHKVEYLGSHAIMPNASGQQCILCGHAVMAYESQLPYFQEMNRLKQFVTQSHEVEQHVLL